MWALGSGSATFELQLHHFHWSCELGQGMGLIFHKPHFPQLDNGNKKQHSLLSYWNDGNYDDKSYYTVNQSGKFD